MASVMPTSQVGVYERSNGDNAVDVTSFSKAWPCLIPQHGPGPKHARRIELDAWQETIVDGEPGAFLRGLIHSDGCRVLNRVNGKDYPRYFFSQVSTDIRELFCQTCRQLGIGTPSTDGKRCPWLRRTAWRFSTHSSAQNRSRAAF